MFRVKGNKIKIFAKYVALQNGTHTIRVDKETSIVYTDGNTGEPVCQYTYDSSNGRLTVNSLLSDLNLPYEAPTHARSWMNGRKISSGPIYEGHDINVYLEGFAFDFDYNSIACTAMAIKPFRWAGGRVCFDDMYSSGNTKPRYTALPASGACGSSMQDTYGSGLGTVADVASMYGAPTSGSLMASQQNAIQWYGNATSIVFSYRSFRKYLSFARGMGGIFECSIGAIGGNSANIEPDGVIPDPTNKSFEFSMFNLKQI